jgi:hypothetical protein
MRFIRLFVIFLSITVSSQEIIDANLIKEQAIQADFIVSVDPFGTQFLISDNVLSKQTNTKTLQFNNLSLGNITSADAYNPLKPNVFYEDFNTVIILDNRLAEVALINFNTISPNRNITHVSTGFDNTIWIFNKLTQQLELFDYKTNKSRITSLPIQGDVLEMVSNFNSCWLLTNKFIYHFNYFGSLITKIENKGYTNLSLIRDKLLLYKENKLFVQEIESKKSMSIALPELLIKQFFVTNETLYIYDGKILYQYQLIND